MRITASAGKFAGALALAASLPAALPASNKRKGFEGLGAIHIKAADDAITITTNVLDHALTLTLPATVEAAGDLALSSERLAALSTALPSPATVAIARDDAAPIAHIRCGRSHFRLATMPLDWLPAVPKLAEEVGRVELAREEVLTLLRPAFAAAKEQSRYYISGVLIHDSDSDLAAVATDGYRLVRFVIPGAAGLSSDHRLNIPAPALKIIGKILAGKSIERVTLRRSDALLAVETPSASFVSKLIDGTFPDYTRLLPKPSGNSVTVDRAEFMLALDRARAAIEGEHIIGLAWTAAEPVLRLCHRDSDAVDDAIAAETIGTGRVATKIAPLVELINQGLNSKRVRLNSHDGTSPLLITEPDDADVLALHMPCIWPAQAHPLDIPPSLRRAAS